MGVAYPIAPYSTKLHTVTIFLPLPPGSPEITGSFWMVTDCVTSHGLSFKCGDMPLTLQCVQAFFTKL